MSDDLTPNSTDQPSATEEQSAQPKPRQIDERRLMRGLMFGLGLAFLLELAHRQLPDSFPGAAISAPILSLAAVFIFAFTALAGIRQIPGAPRARWAIVAAITGLIICQTLSVTGGMPLFKGVPVLGKGEFLHDFLRNVTFVGGFCLILAGFYFLVFELIMAKNAVEADRERLSDEVDERRAVEATLRDTKERYTKIFESTDEAILILNERRKILQFNPRFAEMLGYGAGEVTRNDTLSLIHPLDRALFADHHRKLMAGHEVERSFEFRMVHRSGAMLYVCGSFDRIRRNHAIICAHGIIRDVTKLKEAQQAQLYRLHLESIISTTSTKFISGTNEELDNNILSALRDVGEFIGADRAYVFQFPDDMSKITYTHEWLLTGVPSAKATRMNVSESSLPHFAAAMRAREVYHIPSVDAMPPVAEKEQTHFRAQGMRAVVAVPMTFQGSLVGLVGIDFMRAAAMVSDDTISLLKTVGEIFAGSLIRQRTQTALRQSEAKYRRILDAIIEAYYEIDLEGNLTFFNGALVGISGYSAAELMRMNFRALFSKETGVELGMIFDAVRQTGAPMDAIEWPFIRKDRSEGFLEASGALIEGPDGRPAGYRGIIRDVTERHLAEEEQKQLQMRMQQAQKLESMGMLAGGIAHDFNNLLMGVLANASIALEEIAPDSPGRKSLESIELSAQRAADLANQMLTYSGKARLIVQPMNLSALVLEMGNLLQASTSKRAVVTYDLNDALPAIEGDPTQLRQVVMNLITNASEAMEDRDGTIALRTYPTELSAGDIPETNYNFEIEPGRYVCLEVRDEGCGMDDATRERIFDPFFTSKFTGRGLGLATVMGIVRGHYGAIMVDSKLGVGTVFRVYFPASDAIVPIANNAPRVFKAAAGEGTVLIVDDESLILDVTQRILERSGYSVLTAHDGFECIEQLEAHPSRVVAVLLDMTMPRMNGVETFGRIKQMQPDLPVILTSGFNEHDARDHFHDAAPSGFIQKPYRSNDLVTKLQEVLNLSAVG